MAWRVRADRFYSQLAAAETREEFQATLEFSDPPVARWFVASMRGLHSRRVGGVRCSMAQCTRAHGIGVNRRSFVRGRDGRYVVEGAAEHDVPRAWWSTGVDDARVHGVGDLDDLGAALRRTPSTLGGWQGKCLQGAIASLADGRVHSSLLGMFDKLCANHAPSGGCSGREASRNLYMVQHVLRRSRVFVKVLASTSAKRTVPRLVVVG